MQRRSLHCCDARTLLRVEAICRRQRTGCQQVFSRDSRCQILGRVSLWFGLPAATRGQAYLHLAITIVMSSRC